jgi:hypothetical protein
MTLALPPRTNIPRATKKNPKDTPNRVFNKLAWYQNYGTEGVHFKEVEPGDYAGVVEVNRDRFPSSSSDYDNSPEIDVGDSDTKIDNLIVVTLKPGEDEE